VRLRQISAAHPRWGWRKAYWVLRSQGLVVNHKRVRSYWCDEGLKRPARARKKQRIGPQRGQRLAASAPDHMWAPDFQVDVTPRSSDRHRNVRPPPAGSPAASGPERRSRTSARSPASRFRGPCPGLGSATTSYLLNGDRLIRPVVGYQNCARPTVGSACRATVAAARPCLSAGQGGTVREVKSWRPALSVGGVRRPRDRPHAVLGKRGVAARRSHNRARFAWFDP